MEKIQMKGKKRVKGTVLFTVVAVMLVMVVFLLSTLILTTSANRRSYYTYYQTQAQYATSAALDAITNYAYSDKDFSDWVTSAEVSDGNEHEIMVRFANTELPLSDSEATPDSVRCTVQSDKPHYTYDSVTGKIHEQKAWKITATAVVGAGRNQTSYSMVNYIYANVKTGDTSGRENTVTYNRYTYDQTLQNGSNPNNPPVSFATAMYTLGNTSGAGNSEGNMMVLGPQYSGMTTLPVGRLKYANHTTTPLLTYANNSGVVGGGMYINNFFSDVEYKVDFQQKGENVKFYGDVWSDENIGLNFVSNIKVPAATGSEWDYKTLNYVYVDGKLGSCANGNTAVQVGAATSESANNSTMPVNLYAGAVDFGSTGTNRTLYVQGDTYLYDPDLDSYWYGKGATELAEFVNKNVNGKNSYFSGEGGSLICNNKTLYLGNNLTIEGDLVFTNPAGKIVFNSAVTVKGRFFCAGQIEGLGNLTCANQYTTTAASKTQMGTSYGAGYPATGYPTDANHDYRLFPFAMRLDEMFTTYYRWDLADNANWHSDALVLESEKAGHTWTLANVPRESVTVNNTTYDRDTLDPAVNADDSTIEGISGYALWQIKNALGDNAPVGTSGNLPDGSKIVLTAGAPYNGGQYTFQKMHRAGEIISSTSTVNTTYVKVPCTHPVGYNATTNTAPNAFMQPFEPITPSTAAAKVSKQSGMNIDTYETFKNAHTAVETNKYDSGNIGNTSKSITMVYPQDGEDALKADTQTVYYINKDCTINLNGVRGTIFIDPTEYHLDNTKPSLAIAFEGVLEGGTKIVVNNTAVYDVNGTLTSVFGPATASVAGVSGNGKYAGRQEVVMFLKSTFNSASTDPRNYMTTTGLYDAMINKDSYNVVANPYYPGQTEYASLSDGEQWKFMYIPNNVIFGEKGCEFSYQSMITTGAIMMPNSDVAYSGSRNKVGTVMYREEHSSSTYTATNHALATIGTLVCADFKGSNWPMTIYLGDLHRPNGSTPSTPEQNSTTGSDDRKPNSGDGKDYLNNDHMGAN